MDDAGSSLAVARQYLDENTKPAAIVHVPKGLCGGETDRGGIVIERRTEFGDGAARLHIAEGRRGDLPNLETLVVETAFDQMYHLRPQTDGTERGDGLPAAIRGFFGDAIIEYLPCVAARGFARQSLGLRHGRGAGGRRVGLGRRPG